MLEPLQSPGLWVWCETEAQWVHLSWFFMLVTNHISHQLLRTWQSTSKQPSLCSYMQRETLLKLGPTSPSEQLKVEVRCRTTKIQQKRKLRSSFCYNFFGLNPTHSDKLWIYLPRRHALNRVGAWHQWSVKKGQQSFLDQAGRPVPVKHKFCSIASWQAQVWGNHKFKNYPILSWN